MSFPFHINSFNLAKGAILVLAKVHTTVIYHLEETISKVLCQNL
jgi:hypothetical protein